MKAMCSFVVTIVINIIFKYINVTKQFEIKWLELDYIFDSPYYCVQ